MYVETGIAYCKHISPPGSSSPGDLFETTSGICIEYPPSFKHKIISYWAWSNSIFWAFKHLSFLNVILVWFMYCKDSLMYCKDMIYISLWLQIERVTILPNGAFIYMNNSYIYTYICICNCPRQSTISRIPGWIQDMHVSSQCWSRRVLKKNNVMVKKREGVSVLNMLV